MYGEAPRAWKCSGCGNCCRLAKIWWSTTGTDWPYGYRGLSCAMLDEETNRCSIYETRPAVCRVSAAIAAGISEAEVLLQLPCRL